MKIRVSFVADVTVHGGAIRKDELVAVFVEWLYESDVPFSDAIAEYVPNELEFDSIELTIDNVNAR